MYGGWELQPHILELQPHIWITTVVIIRPSQPSLAGVGAGAELGNIWNKQAVAEKCQAQVVQQTILMVYSIVNIVLAIRFEPLHNFHFRFHCRSILPSSAPAPTPAKLG